MKFLRDVFKWIGRHKGLGLLLIVLLVSVSLLAARAYTRSQGQLSEPLKRGTIAEAVYGIGTIIANQSLQIRPGQISHLDRYFCKEGDFVERGDPLITLDGILWRAPFDGTITSLPFKTGENVYAAGPVLTLTDLNDRYMTVSLEQQGALRVKPGQAVKMSFDTIREESYDGVVKAVYSNESNFLARIDFKALPARILPGMTADVAIIIRTRDDVLLVPVAAIEQGRLWIKRGGAVPVLEKIKTGIIDKDMAEITEGEVAEGDRVLIKGVAKQ